jgi:hypothetical protein
MRKRKARQATDDNIIWGMRFACRITKRRIQKYTPNSLHLLLFHGNNFHASVLSYKYIACFVKCGVELSALLIVTDHRQIETQNYLLC